LLDGLLDRPILFPGDEWILTSQYIVLGAQYAKYDRLQSVKNRANARSLTWWWRKNRHRPEPILATWRLCD